MKRRTFIKKSALGTAAMVSPNMAGIALNKNIKITVLHTNDQHSRIEPFSNSNSRNANKGGFARRAALVNEIRKKEEHVILLDSGDIFQGTPYFNYFEGEVEFKLMSYLKYDAATIGNHDFDNGIEGLHKQMPNATFDFICSNYDFSNTIMNGFTQPYKIIIKDKIKIGIFGLGIELSGLVSSSLFKETKYLDPIEMSKEMVQQLKAKGCDYIICLSHLGFKYSKEPNKISDVKLAQNTSGIDLILGGHTHTFLGAPVVEKNKDGKEVAINQVGFAGLYLGRIDITFEAFTSKKSYAWQNVAIDHRLDHLV